MVVGGDRDADVTIPHASVAARQALLSREGRQVRITSLADGCAINGASLTRDMPSSLEEGDLLRLGNVTLEFTYRKLPVTPALADAPRKPRPAKREPKAKPKPTQAKPAARPVAAAARPARRQPPSAVARAAPDTATTWKLAVIVLAFVVVILAAILAALWKSNSEVLGSPVGAGADPSPTPSVAEVSLPAKPAAKSDDAKPLPVAEQPPPAKKQPPAMQRGVPPAGGGARETYPDLLELADKTFRVAHVTKIEPLGIEATGRDGRAYRVEPGDIVAIHDRADLALRVQRRRESLGDGVEARLRLAQWCVTRYEPAAARRLLADVLAQAPMHKDAADLQRRLNEG